MTKRRDLYYEEDEWLARMLVKFLPAAMELDDGQVVDTDMFEPAWSLVLREHARKLMARQGYVAGHLRIEYICDEREHLVVEVTMAELKQARQEMFALEIFAQDFAAKFIEERQKLAGRGG